LNTHIERKRLGKVNLFAVLAKTGEREKFSVLKFIEKMKQKPGNIPK
jgi:hypothetical protein